MNKKISLLLSLILVLSLALTACGKAETGSIEAIKERGSLIVGTSPDYPPFEFILDGEIVGIDAELASFIAGDLGVDLEFKQMDFGNLLNGLSTGMVDIVLAGMNPTEEREKMADFSDIYYEAKLGVLTKLDNDSIKLEEDLAAKKIGVQIGTTQESYALKSDSFEVVSLKSNPDIVMSIKTNKIDGGIMELPVVKSFVKANDDLKLVEDLVITGESEGIAVATKKGNTELIEEINKILAKAKDQGLIDKWVVEAQALSEFNME